MFTSSFKSFAKQNRSALYCFLLSGLFFFLASIDMQGHPSGKLISISPFLGSEIDPDEYFRYRFHEIEPVQKREFLSAQVFQLKDNLFLLQIELKGGKERIKSFNREVLALFRLNIERYGKKLLRSVDRISYEMENGRYPLIQVELTNEIKMKGQVLDFSSKGLSMRSEIGTFNFSLESLKAIAFVDEKSVARVRLAYARR